jgi:replication factor C small subunit
MKPQSIPQAVLILADYQYKAAFVADHEINTVACLTEIMVECEFI